MNFDTTVDVDLNDVMDFAENKLSRFLVEETTDWGTAAFILQSVLDAVEEARAQISEEENND
jgi:hypothetical protein